MLVQTFQKLLEGSIISTEVNSFKPYMVRCHKLGINSLKQHEIKKKIVSVLFK